MDKQLCVIYTHPCSTNTLVYIIPKKFDEILKNDPNFKIGFYRTPFKEYLNKYYDDDRHKQSVFYKTPFIRTTMELELEESDICDIPYIGGTETCKGQKIEISINDQAMYYYELCSWSLNGPSEYERLLKKLNLGEIITEGIYTGVRVIENHLI